MLSFPFKRYLYGYISNNRQTVIIHSLVYYYFPLLKIQSDIFDPHNQFHLITYFSDIQTFFLGYSKDFPNNLLNFITEEMIFFQGISKRSVMRIVIENVENSKTRQR